MSKDQQIVGFDQLDGTDLVIDRIYQGGRAGNTGDDPLGKLLPVGNQGGFRISGSPKRDSVKVAVLYTSGVEPDWPDVLDPYTGVFTYFGDNRSPGRLLEDTPRSGNLLLSRAFARAHGEPADRAKVQSIIDQVNNGQQTDVRAAVQQIDAALTPDESKAVLGERDKMIAAIKANMPAGQTGPGANGGGQHGTMGRGNDAGRFLLQVGVSREKMRQLRQAAAKPQ